MDQPKDADANIDAGRPMSQSRRLWIVLSILLGALSAMIAYKEHRHAFAIVEYADGMADQAFWARAQEDPRLSNCDWSTAHHDAPYDGHSMVTCDTKDPFTPALPWAFLPAAVMAAFVLAVRRSYWSPTKVARRYSRK
jgi:hypothetical protein